MTRTLERSQHSHITKVVGENSPEFLCFQSTLKGSALILQFTAEYLEWVLSTFCLYSSSKSLWKLTILCGIFNGNGPINLMLYKYKAVKALLLQPSCLSIRMPIHQSLATCWWWREPQRESWTAAAPFWSMEKKSRWMRRQKMLFKMPTLNWEALGREY